MTLYDKLRLGWLITGYIGLFSAIIVFFCRCYWAGNKELTRTSQGHAIIQKSMPKASISRMQDGLETHFSAIIMWEGFKVLLFKKARS